jgi:hypothetical protein
LIGIVASDHEPVASVAKALLHLAQTLDLQGTIEKKIQSALSPRQRRST